MRMGARVAEHGDKLARAAEGLSSCHMLSLCSLYPSHLSPVPCLTFLLFHVSFLITQKVKASTLPDVIFSPTLSLLKTLNAQQITFTSN